MTRSRVRPATAAFATAILALTACGSPALSAPDNKVIVSAKPRPRPTTSNPASSGTDAPTGAPSQPSTHKPNVSAKGPAGSARVTGDKSVALTFDDGPDPVYTPQILDLLKANKITATFCLVGFRARKHPALVRRIVAEGHTLCNHTWQHRFDLRSKSNAAILKDLQATNTAILNAEPNAKIKYFRAAGGNYNPRLVSLAGSLGMKSLYWAVDTRDWEHAKYGRGTKMVNHIIAAVHADTRPGSIVLAHDLNKPDTIAAFRSLLPWLKGRFTVTAMSS